MAVKDKRLSAHKPKSLLSKILGVTVFIVTLIVAILFLTSAWAGWISPLSNKIAPIWAMTFPIWLASLIAIFILDLIWWRKTAIMAFLSLLICIPQIWDYCPLNLPKGKMNKDQSERALTIMTYNVLQFVNQNKDYDLDYNDMLRYIINKKPDVVCIQEAGYMHPNKRNRISQAQIEKLHEIYPYVFYHRSEFAFLSKFEAEPIPVDFPYDKFGSGDVAGWRLIKDGVVINVFGVHLRSYRIDPSLRQLWKELTTPETTEAKYLKEARKELAPLIIQASQDRAEQVQALENILRKFGGETAILCGDFNDPENSYSVHYLEENCNMKQAYSEVGFGPMITYNSSNFFFRIDHVLYRGKLKPYSIKRGNTKASDHYPLSVTFLVDK